MGAAHVARVERDDVQQVAHPRLLAQERRGGPGLDQAVVRVQEQLRGVVAGLAVDLDGAREVRGALRVEPVVVREPRVALGQSDEVPGALVSEAGGISIRSLEHQVHAPQRADRLPGAGQVLRRADVDVCDLVVSDRERARRPGIEVLHPCLLVDAQQPGAAQRAIDLHRARGRRDPVLGEHDHPVAATARVLDQVAEDLVQLRGRTGGLGRFGPEALEVVVEVRQVGQEQVEPLGVEQPPGRLRDPARRRDPGARAPVREERELAQGRRQPVVQLGRIRVAVRVLAPVRVVDRPRGDRQVGARAHRVPPAHVGGPEPRLGAAGGLPHLLALHQAVVLAPEQHLAQVAEVPAVADDPVLRRLEPGEERRLHRAGDRREDRVEAGLEAVVGKPAHAGHVAERAGRQAHGADDDQRHAATSEPSSSRRSRVHASSAARPSTRRSSASTASAPSGSTLQV